MARWTGICWELRSGAALLARGDCRWTVRSCGLASRRDEAKHQHSSCACSRERIPLCWALIALVRPGLHTNPRSASNVCNKQFVNMQTTPCNFEFDANVTYESDWKLRQMQERQFASTEFIVHDRDCLAKWSCLIALISLI
jgi:hypothetical protein